LPGTVRKRAGGKKNNGEVGPSVREITSIAILQHTHALAEDEAREGMHGRGGGGRGRFASGSPGEFGPQKLWGAFTR